MFKVAKSAVQKTIDLFKIYKGGAWKDIAFARVWRITDGVGAWKEFYTLGSAPPSTPTPPPIIIPPPPPPANLTVTPGTYITASGQRVGSGMVYSNTVTLGVSGGTAPYTFTWSKTSGSGAVSVNPANTAQAQFRANVTGNLPQKATGYFQCIIQDANGNTKTVTIYAKFYAYSFSEYNNEDLPDDWWE